MTNIKTYRDDYEGKEAFVKEVVSPLLVQTNTGWYGAEYECLVDTNTGERMGEYVYLLNALGRRMSRICVNANSNQAIVRDVFKNI